MRSTSSKSDEINSTAIPLLERELQQMVDVRLCADVDADRRLLENEKLDMRLHPAREDHLLLIAAGQRRDRLLRPRRLDGKAPHRRLGLAELGRARDELQHPFAARRGVQVDILAHVEVRGEALLRPAARYEADALGHRFGRAQRRNRRAVERQSACSIGV